MTREEAVKSFLEKVKSAYIEDQKAKGIRASGKSASSLRIQDTSILGSHYFQFQKQGRRPGKFPPVEAIIQWLKDKQLNISEERGPGLKGLAFLIARKIARQGTDIHTGKRPALSIEEKLKELRKDLVKDIISAEREKILSGVKRVEQK